MAGTINLRLEDADRAREIAAQINSFGADGAMSAHADGAALTLIPNNPAIFALMDALLWPLRLAGRLFRADDEGEPDGLNASRT